MGQKICPRCGLICEKEQYICPHCFFDFVVNPPSSKRSRYKAEKIKEEMISNELEKKEKPKTQENLFLKQSNPTVPRIFYCPPGLSASLKHHSVSYTIVVSVCIVTSVTGKIVLPIQAPPRATRMKNNKIPINLLRSFIMFLT